VLALEIDTKRLPKREEERRREKRRGEERRGEERRQEKSVVLVLVLPFLLERANSNNGVQCVRCSQLLLPQSTKQSGEHTPGGVAHEKGREHQQ
jgi:hypothetical protein